METVMDNIGTLDFALSVSPKRYTYTRFLHSGTRTCIGCAENMQGITHSWINSVDGSIICRDCYRRMETFLNKYMKLFNQEYMQVITYGTSKHPQQKIERIYWDKNKKNGIN